MMPRGGGVDVLVPASAAAVSHGDGGGVASVALATDGAGRAHVLYAGGAIAIYDRDRAGPVARLRLPPPPAANVSAGTTPIGDRPVASFASDGSGGLRLAHGTTLYEYVGEGAGSRSYRVAVDLGRPVRQVFTAAAETYVVDDGGLARLTRAGAPMRLETHRGLAYFPLDGDRVARLAKDGALQLLRLGRDTTAVTDELPMTTGVWTASWSTPGDTLAIGTDNGVITAAYDAKSGAWALSPAAYPRTSFYALASGPRGGGPYALTSRGLARRQPSGGWDFFTTADGVPPDLDHDAGFAVSPDGTAWVGTPTQTVSIALREAAELPYAGALHVRAVHVDGRRLGGAADVSRTLAHDHESVTVALGTTGVYGERGATVEYRLVGFREAWRRVDAEGRAQFDRLPPGDYRFEARASDDRGRRLPPVALAITVVPPYYSTWWFRALAVAGIVAVVAASVYAVSRRKLKRTREALARQTLLAEERDRVARELHDDIGGTLSSILWLSEEDDDDDDPAGHSDDAQGGEREALPRIAALSRTALVNMREIIWMLDERNADLASLMTHVGDQARATCTDRGIDFELVGPRIPPEAFATIPGSVRKELSLLIKEAVSNAAKHSGAERVVVSFRESAPDALRVTVEDDGIGFETSARRPGNGLRNMRHRATRVSGQLQIESRHGGGTRLTLEVPLA